MAKAERDAYFTKWAKDRADATKIDGVLVHITMNPGHLEVLVTQNAQKALPEADRKKLFDLLFAGLRDKKYEQGLTDGVKFVKERFQANIPPAVVALPKP